MSSVPQKADKLNLSLSAWYLLDRNKVHFIFALLCIYLHAHVYQYV